MYISSFTTLKCSIIMSVMIMFSERVDKQLLSFKFFIDSDRNGRRASWQHVQQTAVFTPRTVT